MSGKHNSNITPGARVKYIRKKNKWTQAQLSEAIHLEPNHISMIENGKRGLTVEKAQIIASLFPPTRYQYLLCEDDFETDNDLIDAFIDGTQNRYDRKISGLTKLASIREFTITLISSGMVIGPSGRYEDCYKIEHNGKEIYASYSEIMDWIEDILDYIEVKLNRKIRQKEI